MTTASQTSGTSARVHERSRAQWASLIVGIAFLAVGILGFIPGITTDYDSLGFVDQHGAKLLGIFEVNALHNIVHLAFGVALGMLVLAAAFWRDERWVMPTTRQRADDVGLRR
jgi:hypothetical protein